MAMYIFMRRDELGDKQRAFGTQFLSGVHVFPSFSEDDEAMCEAFEAWRRSLVERGQAEWEATFGPESRIFLERLVSDMSPWEMAQLGLGEL